MAALMLAAFVAFILFVLWREQTSTDRPRATPAVTPPAPYTTATPTPSRTGTRPVGRQRRTASAGAIRFNGAALLAAAAGRGSLDGVCDPLTGRALDGAKPLYRCGRCSLAYEASSYAALSEENGGSCLGCGTASLGLVPPVVSAASTRVRWQNILQTARSGEQATTIETYRDREGQVAVFEGRCLRVLASRRGDTFAVMFQEGTWAAGFKAVVFPDGVRRLGGEGTVRALHGRLLRIRGRVQRHGKWGWQIVLADRSMLEVLP